MGDLSGQSHTIWIDDLWAHGAHLSHPKINLAINTQIKLHHMMLPRQLARQVDNITIVHFNDGWMISWTTPCYLH